MDADPRRLPYEILELIIDFASDPSPQNTNWYMRPKRTLLLVCALVCRTWLSIARPRLVAFHVKLGVVKLFATPQEFLTFRNVFGSPLCTFDRTLIRVLNIGARSYWKTFVVSPISMLLYILSEISLPSLHTISFPNVYLTPKPSIDKDDDGIGTFVPPMSQATLPQVTKLVFSAFEFGPLALGFIVKTTQFFPCLESLTAQRERGAGLKLDEKENLCHIRPPQSLRELVVDASTIVGLVEWLTACDHTNISSLLLHDDNWLNEGAVNHLSLALNTLGRSLEELEIGQ